MAKDKKARGTKTMYVFLPHIIFITILYIFIIVSTSFLNMFSTLMSNNTQSTADSITIINEFQAQSSKLSATAINFAHNPYSESTNTLNEDPLKRYFNEISDVDRNPDKTLERLEKFEIDTEASDYINRAVKNAETMLEHQAHAFTLIDLAVREYSEANNLENEIYIPEKYFLIIDKYNLTDEEKAYTYQKKIEVAEELLLDSTYSSLQNSVLSYTKLAVNSISETNNVIQQNYNSRLIFARSFLWISIILIVLTTTILFIILFTKLIFPIDDFAKRIDNNEKLDTNKGLYEANYLATAYNNLLIRHEEYDNLLKDVAETDSLTGLPNRYSLNKFLNQEIEEAKSTCLFMLDINNLKYMNDTYGHDKGDELIKNASICIKDAFLDKNGKNCYRIGGDEFVVILDGISQNDIDQHLKIFADKLKQYNVSIAYGYSYSSNVKEYGYEKLMIEADKLMYENKEMIKNKEKSTNRDTIIYS